jgi:hypothetical protein
VTLRRGCGRGFGRSNSDDAISNPQLPVADTSTDKAQRIYPLQAQPRRISTEQEYFESITKSPVRIEHIFVSKDI